MSMTPDKLDRVCAEIEAVGMEVEAKERANQDANATFYGRAQFRIRVTERQVSALCRLAGVHYDHHCKCAALDGGFLRGWHNAVTYFADRRVDHAIVDATWGELDTLLKVCELASAYLDSNEDRALVHDTVKTVTQVMGEARKAESSLSWKHWPGE